MDASRWVENELRDFALDRVSRGGDSIRERNEDNWAPLTRPTHIVVVAVVIGDGHVLTVDGERATLAATAAFGGHAQARKLGRRQPDVVCSELLLAECRLHGEQRQVTRQQY